MNLFVNLSISSRKPFVFFSFFLSFIIRRFGRTRNAPQSRAWYFVSTFCCGCRCASKLIYIFNNMLHSCWHRPKKTTTTTTTTTRKSPAQIILFVGSGCLWCAPARSHAVRLFSSVNKCLFCGIVLWQRCWRRRRRRVDETDAVREYGNSIHHSEEETVGPTSARVRAL